MISGKHLIAGEWQDGDVVFDSSPAQGPKHTFSTGSQAQVEQAVLAAEEAFWTYGYSKETIRAEFLHAIADEIELRADAITEIGSQETGLPEARLIGERGRTTGQLRTFAEYILRAEQQDTRHDQALPDRTPIPRPDLQMRQRPIGPVAIFGASNFPLAFSVAGGDTASAFAAGCPVIVKGHPAHPGTAEIVAQAIDSARQKCDLHPGIFSLIQDAGISVGQALVKHPLICAVGFTGSLGAGRELFNLCAQRETPIPFYGELGSINPMFLLPTAMRRRGEQIATEWIASLVMGAGQFCTNPGVLIYIKNENSDEFIKSLQPQLKAITPQIMLTQGIADTCRAGVSRIASLGNVEQLYAGHADHSRSISPTMFRCDGNTWRETPMLSEEVFGPVGILVEVNDFNEMQKIAYELQGQLTCTIHLDETDHDLAKKLLPILERKAGRILANGFPTGVEVCDAMVHSGPYPASTNFGATSVGTMAIRRFLRPVCYQNMTGFNQ